MDIPRRSRGETWVAHPCRRRQAELVSAALKSTLARHKKALRALSKR